MKFSLPLVTLALVAALLYSTEYVAAREICPQESCLTADKCDSPVIGGMCQEQGATCCSVVKPEFRTHCRHFGGECMDNCGVTLQHKAVDCPANQVCCTLI